MAARHRLRPGLAATSFHPLDGARYLRDTQHADALLCRLVAHHSCALIEAATSFPVWPAWALGVLTIGATYMCFALLPVRWPFHRRVRQGSGRTTTSHSRRQVEVALIADSDGARLRLLLQNQGKPAEFSVQVIAIRDPLGREIGRQIWTVPWQDDFSTDPKRILTGQTGILDFAQYDPDAVRNEIAVGGGESPHWLFSTARSPITARYYNLRENHDLDEQRFHVDVRIMNAGSGKYTDRELAVGVHRHELVCDVMTP